LRETGLREAIHKALETPAHSLGDIRQERTRLGGGSSGLPGSAAPSNVYGEESLRADWFSPSVAENAHVESLFSAAQSAWQYVSPTLMSS
jgi:hypothetical protein